MISLIVLCLISWLFGWQYIALGFGMAILLNLLTSGGRSIYPRW